jgi:hypothetical protein
MSSRRRESIQKSISQIIQLHEDLLVELQQVVPTRGAVTHQPTPRRQHCRSKHMRWHSADTGYGLPKGNAHRHRFRSSVDMSRSSSPIARSMSATTNTVLSVAKVFDRFVSSSIRRNVVMLNLPDATISGIRGLRGPPRDCAGGGCYNL